MGYNALSPTMQLGLSGDLHIVAGWFTHSLLLHHYIRAIATYTQHTDIYNDMTHTHMQWSVHEVSWSITHNSENEVADISMHGVQMFCTIKSCMMSHTCIMDRKQPL